MYRINDFVLFENQLSQPYKIKKIIELKRCPSGTIQAKVISLYRLNELSLEIQTIAEEYIEEHVRLFEKENNKEFSGLELSQIKQSCLFPDVFIENVTAAYIRGKCTVTSSLLLKNDSTFFDDCIDKDDAFFYFQFVKIDKETPEIVFDIPNNIRIGSEYQADLPTVGMMSERDCDDRDKLLFSRKQQEAALSDDIVNEYELLSKSLALMSRANMPIDAIKQPRLLDALYATNREITLEMSLCVLHTCLYNRKSALSYISTHISVPDKDGLLQWRDQMDLWSVSECSLFADGYMRYGKIFKCVQADYLPWKSLKEIIAFYYFWKTCKQSMPYRQKLSALTGEQVLSQVYIASYVPNPQKRLYKNLQTGVAGVNNSTCNNIALEPLNCEFCGVDESANFFAWGRTEESLKICEACYTRWKRMGDLRKENMPEEIDTEGFDCPQFANPEQTHVTCFIKDCKALLAFANFLHLVSHLQNIHRVSYPISIQRGEAFINRCIALKNGFSLNAINDGPPAPVISLSTTEKQVSFIMRASPAIRLSRCFMPGNAVNVIRVLGRKAGCLRIDFLDKDREEFYGDCRLKLKSLLYEDAVKLNVRYSDVVGSSFDVMYGRLSNRWSVKNDISKIF